MLFAASLATKLPGRSSDKLTAIRMLLKAKFAILGIPPLGRYAHLVGIIVCSSKCFVAAAVGSGITIAKSVYYLWRIEFYGASGTW